MNIFKDALRETKSEVIAILICLLIVIIAVVGTRAIRRYEEYTTEPTTQIQEKETGSQTSLTTEATTEAETTLPKLMEPLPTTTATTTVPITHISVLDIPSEWTTEAELTLIASVVMNEAGYESYEGKVAVAQCILNACRRQNKPFSQVRYMYGYTTTKQPTEAVNQAVRDVFLKGVTITDEPIIFYYAPAYGYSSFHESQAYVMTIGGHRFFKEKGT